MAGQYGDNRRARPISDAPGNSGRHRNTDPGRVGLSSAEIRNRLDTRQHIDPRRRSLLEAALALRSSGGARPGPGPSPIGQAMGRPNIGPGIGIGGFEQGQINRIGAPTIGGMLGGARPGPGPMPIAAGHMGAGPPGIGAALGNIQRPTMDPARTGMAGGMAGMAGALGGLIPGFNPARPVQPPGAPVGFAPMARFGGLVNPVPKFANRGLV